MRYSQLVTPQRSEVVHEPNWELGPGEVQIRVTTCSVCASELHPWNDGASAYPRRLGHEPVEVVLAVGPDVTWFKEVDRVTGLFHEAFSDTCIAPETVLLLFLGGGGRRERSG